MLIINNMKWSGMRNFRVMLYGCVRFHVQEPESWTGRTWRACCLNSRALPEPGESKPQVAPVAYMAESCIDLAQNLSRLLCDPIFYGTNVPRGDGSPVLLIPGFFAGDWSLSTLARWLSRVGYRPYLSGIDWNVGCPDEKSQRLGWRLAHITDECGMPAIALGHSLGGVLARAL